MSVFEFQNRIYIDQSSSCLFESESGLHQYQSVIFIHLVRLSLSRDRTYIDRSSSYHFSFQDRTSIDRSFFVSVWVFGVAPISIGHPLVSLCSVWVGTAPILTGHHLVSMSLRFGVRTHIDCPYSYQLMFSLSWGRSYIDWPSSYHFRVSFLFFGTAPISISHLSSYQFEFAFWGPHPYQSAIFLSICVQFELGSRLYRSIIYRLVSFSLSFRGRTYIDRPSSYHFLVNLSLGWVLGPHLYRSVIILSCQFTFELGSHLYW